MNEARTALSRVQLRDSYVMRETSDIFIAHLQEFQAATPEQAEQRQEAVRESLEQAYGYSPSRDRTDRKPFVYQDGFAIIPVHGALLNRFGGSYSFATGYNYIRAMLNAALEDDDVKVIVFDVDSPGGEAAGCFELATEIRASRDKKPSLAVVDALSASAGYALASAATRMVATPSSKIGSIGVVRMHIDMSGMLEKNGLKVTLIEAPEDGMKTAGSPFSPLSDEAKKDFQLSVNKAYDDFVELIVLNRGMGADEVRETKARVFRAEEALALRLIDAVKTPSEAVSSFLAELADDDIPDDEEDDDMATPEKKEAPAGSEATSVDQAAITAAVTADRERMTSIKALPEAAERPKLADTLALQGMSVEQSKTILAAAAVETPPAAAAAAPAAAAPAADAVDTVNHLDAAMDKTKQPNVGAGEGDAALGGDDKDNSESLAATILKDQGAIVGTNFGAAKAA